MAIIEKLPGSGGACGVDGDALYARVEGGVVLVGCEFYIMRARMPSCYAVLVMRPSRRCGDAGVVASRLSSRSKRRIVEGIGTICIGFYKSLSANANLR